MHDTALFTKEAVGDHLAGTPAPPKRIFALAGAIVALGLAVLAAAAIYSGSAAFSSTVAVHPGSPVGATTQPRYHKAMWFALLATLGCSAAGLATLAGGLVAWQRRWQSYSAEREKDWRKRAAVLHGQIAESRGSSEAFQRSHSDSSNQLARYAKEIAALQSELEQLKRSERTLSQQRQVLQSSKAVLELHVQERTQVLQNLKRSYELILNSAGDGICGLDINGKATFVNPATARITGWSTEEMIGKPEKDIFGSPERKRAELTLARKIAELGRSNAELEQFAFVASHDLQEPLRKIQSFGDRLKIKCNGSLAADALNYLERMQNASARMRTLIDDLLAFSRVIRDSQPFVQVDLAVIAKEVLGDLEVLLEKSGGRVEVGDLPTLDGDTTQMRQLLLNLIGNALKFQPPNSKPLVKVSARKLVSISGEERCELTFEDNGIGFEEEYAEKIFAVFQRLHGRGEYEGTGVGLAICRRITDRHQGTIIARSKPGEGATFIVNLPVHQPQPKADA